MWEEGEDGEGEERKVSSMQEDVLCSSLALKCRILDLQKKKTPLCPLFYHCSSWSPIKRFGK